MTVTLVLPEVIAGEIEAAGSLTVETGGVILARAVPVEGGDIRLLARAIRWIPDHLYVERKADELKIAPDGYLPALAEAELQDCVPLWLHTHPGIGASPSPSKKDGVVDASICEVFRIRSGSPYYGTVIASPRTGGFAFTGTLDATNQPAIDITRVVIVGNRIRVVHAENMAVPVALNLFDRNIRAFGRPVQRALGDLRIGLVGCGGTGSAAAEQLVRLGVRHFSLFDCDTISESNLTRVYGSTPADIGHPKVSVLARHLRSIAPDCVCEEIQDMITVQSAARRLTACDIILGCTDDNAGRLILSRLSTYFLIPVIDCGVLLSSGDEGAITGIYGRVTVCGPGHACLICRDRIDLQRAAVEMQTPEERLRLEDEGYAPALGQTEPAVVAFTTAVASAAVSELLERLIGYGPAPRPSEVLLRLHDREISTNVAVSRAGHYCDPQSGKLGLGITEPFLEQLWLV